MFAALIMLAPAAPQIALASPDGANVISIAPDGSTFEILRRGEAVVTPSPLGLDLADAAPWRSLTLESKRSSHVDRRIPLVADKAATARDQYNGLALQFREAGGGRRRLGLEVRAFDDGIAFRYTMRSDRPIALTGERTAFALAADDDCLISRVNSSHEAAFNSIRPAALVAKVRYDVPVVCTTASGRTGYAIAQANLGGYTGSALVREGDRLKVDLSPVPGRSSPAYVGGASLTTAWRVVMLADRPGDLIPSALIGNLNPPAAGDFSWVKPGKAAWDWWSGPTAGMPATMENYRRFIDFAGASGFPYYLIDAGWSFGAGPCCNTRPGEDITRAKDGIDMPALVRRAADKGVRLLLWVHWKNIASRMDEVLDAYQRWGIAGVKVDFMERDDQEMVAFYHRLAAATAKRHMLLDMHGAYPPAGLQRTYPNYVTQEGVLGAEWNKLRPTVTAAHNVALAYTRMLLGPMDYTPGGMRSVAPADYVARGTMPLVQTTRGQALAMYVVYDSPLQMVSDAPEAYAGADGFDFIRAVPTAWDETRFVTGETGRSIAVARRKGDTWYIGAMTDGSARTMTVPLAFLSRQPFRATIWQDGATPTAVARSTRAVSSRDALTLQLPATGGAVAIIAPEGR